MPGGRSVAADAVRGDLVGVNLLSTKSGWVIAEIDGAVDFRPVDGALTELLRVATARTAAA